MGGEGHTVIFFNAHKPTDFIVGKHGQIRLIRFELLKVIREKRLIQAVGISVRHDANIVLVLFAEGLVTIDLVLRHGLISLTHASISSLHSSLTSIKAGALGKIDRGYLRGNYRNAIDLSRREQRTHDRLHLLALIDDAFLQILHIVHSDGPKRLLLVEPEEKHAPFVLIRKRGQGIVKSLGATLVRAFHFHCLLFSLKPLGFLY